MAVVYAYVMSEDHERLKAIAKGANETLAQLVRDCIDEYLEAVGEEPLAMLGLRGRPRHDDLPGAPQEEP